MRLAALLLLAMAMPALAQKAKPVELYIGYSVGGGYDIYARLLARYIGRHLPGEPVVVPRNMEGAGSLRLANWLYKAAPRDGSVIGTIGRGIAFDPLLGGQGAQFQANEFGWIGSANDEVSVCVSWTRKKIARFEDVFTRELIVGGTGATADTDLFPKIINNVLGTRFKVITGYPGGNDVTLAMQRGEVDGRCGWSWSSIKTNHPQWVKDGTINLLVQLSLEKHPDLPQVPLIMDFIKTEEQKSILRVVFARQVMGRPFLAPPGIPAERLAAWRRAFDATMKDKDFLAEAEKLKLEITPVAGDAVQKLVADVYAIPPAEGFQKLGEAMHGHSGKDMGEAYVRFALDHPQRFRLMFGGAVPLSKSPELQQAASATYGALVKAFADHPRPEVAAAAAWALVHGLAYLKLDGHLAAQSAADVIGAVRFAQRAA